MCVVSITFGSYELIVGTHFNTGNTKQAITDPK